MKYWEVVEKARKLYVSKIEDMPVEVVSELLKEAYSAEMPELVVIPYFGEPELVTYEYGELVAVCPMTGIMDLYRVVISYVPDQFICELKSLKFYFLAYKDLPISHELLCSKIWLDFYNAVNPKWLKVELNVATRGGIKTTIVKEGGMKGESS